MDFTRFMNKELPKIPKEIQDNITKGNNITLTTFNDKNNILLIESFVMTELNI